MSAVTFSAGSLLPIAPRALGSMQSEGLSSFLVRLAAAHVVPMHVFARIVLPQVLEDVVARNLFARRRAVWMNGTGAWAESVSQVFSTLTGQARLERMTLLSLRDVIAAPRVLTLAKRWCPKCYREMREGDIDGDCWDPLVWSLDAVRWCPSHACALADRCPRCSRAQPWLPRDTTVGDCAWCGADLALDLVRSSSRSEAGLGRCSVDPHCAALACAVLVERLSAGDRVVCRAVLARRIAGLIDDVDDGNRSAFSRRCAVANMTPTNWVRRGVIRFDHAVRLACRCGVDLRQLLLVGISP